GPRRQGDLDGPGRAGADRGSDRGLGRRVARAVPEPSGVRRDGVGAGVRAGPRASGVGPRADRRRCLLAAGAEARVLMGRKILFITTDQQRYDSLGCNGGGIARTRVVDDLAARGIRYERAYNQNTVCMPARSTMLTGQY